MASPEEMAEKMRQNVPEKTGKDMAAWQQILSASGLEKHGEMVKLLKSEHGVTHGFANLITSDFRNAGAVEVDPVQAQYQGAKADLKPIYDALINAIGGFGSNVEIAPKKAYVSLRAKKQFGLIQPSTRTRVDVGLNLPGEEAGERLEASGSFNAMVTHRVRLSGVNEVDEELIGWLSRAHGAAS